MSYLHQQWRLLITPPARGSWNMAVDETLLDCIAQHTSLPCLRLYAWEPACLSIGYAQPANDIDLTRLTTYAWDWVRRPTGGRAILHTDELTYSVIAPTSDPRVSGSVLESYLRLSKPLLSALYTLHIPAQAQPINPSNKSRANAAVCFEIPSNYEIVVNGKKLMGSAQARRKNTILQHGTLPLWGDLARIVDVLAYSDDSMRQEAASRLTAHATTVEQVLDEKISWDTAAQAFIQAFQSDLDMEFIEVELLTDELAQARYLQAEKYANPNWLERI